MRRCTIWMMTGLLGAVGLAGAARLLCAAEATKTDQPAVDKVSQDAAKLEIEMARHKDASPEAADLLAKLVELYHANGRVFALTRAAQKFVGIHPLDPRHKAMMLKLLDGLEAASRDKEFVTAARQFLIRYGDAPEAAGVEVRLADVLWGMGDRAGSAAAARAVWKRQPDSDAGRQCGVRAVEEMATVTGATSATAAATQAAELAEEMLGKLPKGPLAKYVGWRACQLWRQVGQWARSNVVATRLLKQDLKDDPALLFDVHRAMANNCVQLQQFTNAVTHLLAARAVRDGPEIHWQLLEQMAKAEAKAEDIVAIAKQYIEKYPERDDCHHAQTLLGQAFLRIGDKAAARKALGESLGFEPRFNDKARLFVLNCGDRPEDWAGAERVLLAAIRERPDQSTHLRSVLAFLIYHERMKDEAKVRAALRELVTLSPDESGDTQQAVNWLLDNASSEEEFRAEVARVLASRAANIHLLSFRRALEGWTAHVRSRPGLKDRFKYVQEELRKAAEQSPLGAAAKPGGEDRKRLVTSRDLLLDPEVSRRLSDNAVKALYYSLYDFSRGRVGEAKRQDLLGLGATLCQRFPKDYRLAATCVQAAADVGATGQPAAQAARHLLGFEPQTADAALWQRLLAVLEKAEDPALAKQAHAWIVKARKKHGDDWSNAARLGSSLAKLGLEQQAVEYWRACVSAEPRSDQARLCAEQALSRLAGDERARFLREIMKPDTDFRAKYALWLAGDYLAAGDLKNFEKTVRDAIAWRAQQAFRDSDSEWQIAAGWVQKSRGSDVPEADRKTVFTLVHQLRLRVASSMAQLALLEITPAEAIPPIERLLACQAATRTVGTDGVAWDRLMPYAQAAMTRKDYLGAATLLTGMLAHVPNVDPARKRIARDLITQSYARLGAAGMAIDESSPMAPLLQAALSLRLGNDTLAFSTYLEKRALFDKYRNDLPVDFILFVCERLVAAGGEANFDQVESTLRGWLVKHTDSSQFDNTAKAQVQLLLAKNYLRAQQYDVARSEFTTVVNRWPELPQAIDAQFGIGEALMAQKIYDQAQAVFEKLASSRDVTVVIRAEFLRGVLALRRNDIEEARNILRSVLERVPDVDLANQALFSLSEVYGAEQRYLEQLLLLRTVGRLGRTSKRTHTPGQPLAIVVYDSDLGISRGHHRIPVIVSTEPGGDAETVYLTSGGAGKGLFRADLETRLGAAVKNNSVLEVTGRDVVRCDYPPEFKAQFRAAPLSDVEIRIAANGKLEIASAKIEAKEQETFSKQLEREAKKPEEEEQPISQARPADQVKPGNLIYLRVEDFDRDLSDDIDHVTLKLTASSGDQVQVQLKETGPHTGVFEGTLQTAELPAGALASDSALDHEPLRAIDRDPKTFWQSEPDGATPKWLTVDMKDLKRVGRVRIHTPDPKQNAPVRSDLLGSYDGEFWFTLASVPEEAAVEPVSGTFGAMTRRAYAGRRGPFENWSDVVDLTRNAKPSEESPATSLTWAPGESDDEPAESRAHAIVWHGLLVQPREGAARIKVDGTRAALVVDGRMELPLGPGGRTADVWLKTGTHQVTVFALSINPRQAVGATWARADLASPHVVLQPFRPADFDLQQPAGKTAAAAVRGKTAVQEGVAEFSFEPIDLRYVRLLVREYLGDAVAINHVEVFGPSPEQAYIPTQADIVALANNDILELTGGDMITASYTDEFTSNHGEQSRLLTARLTATYFNATVSPIVYRFSRGAKGQVKPEPCEVLRVDPGDRFVIRVTDYDEDRTKQRDTVPVTVAINDGKPLPLTATETEPHSGEFTKEVDTSAAPEEGKLAIKPGDRIFCTYLDRQNTYPGHAVPREGMVQANAPTDGRVRFIETQLVPPRTGKGDPRLVYLPADEKKQIAYVSLGGPLTVEVIDPDAAKDRRSTVVVSLTTTGGAKLDVNCELSDACRDSSAAKALGAKSGTAGLHEALVEGRFIGQVILQLGGKDSPVFVPRTFDMPRSVIGGPVVPEGEQGEDQTGTVRVLNITGKDVVTAAYRDARRAKGDAQQLTAKARLVVDGQLACTDRDYEAPVRQLHVGERMFLKVIDPDQDVSDERDSVSVEITGDRGEKEVVRLEETLSHSGVFTGSLALVAAEKPAPGNLKAEEPAIETYFGDTLHVVYVDRAAAAAGGTLEQRCDLPVVIGTNGLVTAFSKVFGDEDLAVETKFRIAESHFEMFKGHQALGRKDEAKADLQAGRRLLREVMEDYADVKHTPRVAYLLGQFAQELGEYEEAIKSYEVILRQFTEHPLAADAQYKLAQSHEAAGDFDQALEAYVTLAATYPKSALLPSVMIRVCEHFWKKERYDVAAQVAEKFVEKFPQHEHAAKLAFRIGQCHSKAEDYKKAAAAFDRFVKLFPDDKLCADALFYSGESYRAYKDYKDAFLRYNRCRWDFPSSEAAKYARGRLTLPEMARQFEADSKSLFEKP